MLFASPAAAAVDVGVALGVGVAATVPALVGAAVHTLLTQVEPVPVQSAGRERLL